MAVHYDCKHTEVSTVLHLKVDELLAGILKQICLTSKRILRHRKKNNEYRCMSARGIVGKIFKTGLNAKTSCDDLLKL